MERREMLDQVVELLRNRQRVTYRHEAFVTSHR